MEPWGTSASVLAQGQACPFETARCFLKLKKSVVIFKIFSDIPFCFSLNMSHLFQPLPNTLDISKNTALTSRL